MINLRTSLCLVLLITSSYTAIAQTDVNLPLIGKIKPRSSHEIVSSSWSIGSETLDREFAVYANYKKFLGPLGAKGMRLQAGWAKCEKVPGVYDWAWLDEPVNDALAQGVQPWLQLSYGNPIYVGGGGVNLGAGFPSSPEALAAWDRWVQAIAEHYRGRVYEWEIWNEPDGQNVTAYIELYIRTATILREVQPKGQIYALALAGNLSFADKFLTGMTDRKKLDLIDAVTIHIYPTNDPDDAQAFDKLRERIARTGYPIAVREGEIGAPSKYGGSLARNYPWTENIQAKWDLRRMLALHSKDVPFNLFSLIDQRYHSNGEVQWNHYGLLAARENPPDLTVDYVKPAYYAAQNIFTIFDGSLVHVKNFTCTADANTPLAAFAYKNKDTGAEIAVLWIKNDMPSDSNAKTPTDLSLVGLHLKNPVYVDLLTGKVYALPKPRDNSSFKQVPLYDSPILIAEKAALPLDTEAAQ